MTKSRPKYFIGGLVSLTTNPDKLQTYLYIPKEDKWIHPVTVLEFLDSLNVHYCIVEENEIDYPYYVTIGMLPEDLEVIDVVKLKHRSQLDCVTQGVYMTVKDDEKVIYWKKDFNKVITYTVEEFRKLFND